MKVEVYEYGLRDGEINTVSDTLKLMSKFTIAGRNNVNIILLARRLTNNIPENNKLEMAKRIFYFVRNNIKYINDPFAHELLIEPSKLLVIKQGDCDDKSMLLASLLLSIGIPTRFIAVKRPNHKTFSHVYCEGYIDGKWIPMDASGKNTPFGFACASIKKMIYYPVQYQKANEPKFVKNTNEPYKKESIDIPYQLLDTMSNEQGENMKYKIKSPAVEYVDIPNALSDSLNDSGFNVNKVLNGFFNGVYNISSIVEKAGQIASGVKSNIPTSQEELNKKVKETKDVTDTVKWYKNPLTWIMVGGVSVLSLAFVFMPRKR